MVIFPSDMLRVLDEQLAPYKFAEQEHFLVATIRAGIFSPATMTRTSPRGSRRSAGCWVSRCWTISCSGRIPASIVSLRKASSDSWTNVRSTAVQQALVPVINFLQKRLSTGLSTSSKRPVDNSLIRILLL
jgi:hypothetical protein